MKNHLQQYLYHLALILALAVGGMLNSAEVSAALPAAPEVEAEKITLSDVLSERDGDAELQEWVVTPTKPAALADDLASPAGTTLLKFLSDFDGTLTPAVYANRLKAWEDLLVRNVPDILRSNTNFLNRLSGNPNLVNYVDNLTPAGKTDLANNADEWIKRYDARTPLKNGNYNEAINVLEGTSGTSEVYNGANYVGKLNTPQSPDPIIATPASLQAIVNSTTDVSSIANNLGVSQSVVQGAKQHLFVTEYLVETEPGVFILGRFTTFDHITQWWNSAANGTISNADANSLRKLLGHEYIESALMQQGVVYRQLDVPTAAKYGAHELSVGEETGSFAHWASGLDRNAPSFSLNSDLSNIDNIVDQIKVIEGL